MSKHQSSHTFWIFIWPARRYCSTSYLMPILPLSPLAGTPTDNFMGTVHWRWADKQWDKQQHFMPDALPVATLPITWAWDRHQSILVIYPAACISWSHSLTHSLTAALDQLRVLASSTSNDPGPRSWQHQQIGQRLLPLAAANFSVVEHWLFILLRKHQVKFCNDAHTHISLANFILQPRQTQKARADWTTQLVA